MNTRTRREKELKRIVGPCANCSKPLCKETAIPNLAAGSAMEFWDKVVCQDCGRLYVVARRFLTMLLKVKNDN